MKVIQEIPLFYRHLLVKTCCAATSSIEQTIFSSHPDTLAFFLLETVSIFMKSSKFYTKSWCSIAHFWFLVAIVQKSSKLSSITSRTSLLLLLKCKSSRVNDKDDKVTCALHLTFLPCMLLEQLTDNNSRTVKFSKQAQEQC